MAYNERRRYHKAGLSASEYVAAHRWIRKIVGPPIYCSNDRSHEAKRFEWSNISGTYERDISDWAQLCPSCHRKKDYTDEQKKLMSIKKMGHELRNTPVVQLDTHNNEIARYSSQKKAALAVGVSRTGINNVLNGRAKTSGTYKWRYAL